MRFVLECLSQRRKVEDLIEWEQARERERERKREEYKKKSNSSCKRESKRKRKGYSCVRWNENELTVVVHEVLRPLRSVEGSIKSESVIGGSLYARTGLRPGSSNRRDRLLLAARRIDVPCYRVMSLLFKNHAAVTCAAINYNNVI